MSEEKKKRGRPKGSKNKQKVEEQPQVVSPIFSTIKTSIMGRVPVKAGVNTWTDDGGVPLEDFDKKVVRQKPTDFRPMASKKKIRCSICAREVEIPASLPTTDYYRCERCIGG